MRSGWCGGEGQLIKSVLNKVDCLPVNINGVHKIQFLKQLSAQLFFTWCMR